MAKLTNNYTIRFSDEQINSLNKLKDYDVNISQFIRIAISEKIKIKYLKILLLLQNKLCIFVFIITARHL